jgi:hypothetical protein
VQYAVRKKSRTHVVGGAVLTAALLALPLVPGKRFLKRWKPKP